MHRDEPSSSESGGSNASLNDVNPAAMNHHEHPPHHSPPPKASHHHLQHPPITPEMSSPNTHGPLHHGGPDDLSPVGSAAVSALSPTPMMTASTAPLMFPPLAPHVGDVPPAVPPSSMPGREEVVDGVLVGPAATGATVARSVTYFSNVGYTIDIHSHLRYNPSLTQLFAPDTPAPQQASGSVVGSDHVSATRAAAGIIGQGHPPADATVPYVWASNSPPPIMVTPPHAGALAASGSPQPRATPTLSATQPLPAVVEGIALAAQSHQATTASPSIGGQANAKVDAKLKHQWLLWYDRDPPHAWNSNSAPPPRPRVLAAFDSHRAFWDVWSHFRLSNVERAIDIALKSAAASLGHASPSETVVVPTFATAAVPHEVTSPPVASTTATPSTSERRQGYNLRIFRSDVEPHISDPMNRHGGRFIVRNVIRGRREELWTRLALALVSERLTERNVIVRGSPDAEASIPVAQLPPGSMGPRGEGGNFFHTVVGICLCARPDGDSLQVWTDGGMLSTAARHLAQSHNGGAVSQTSVGASPLYSDMLELLQRCILHDEQNTTLPSSSPNDATTATTTTTTTRTEAAAAAVSANVDAAAAASHRRLTGSPQLQFVFEPHRSVTVSSPSYATLPYQPPMPTPVAATAQVVTSLFAPNQPSVANVVGGHNHQMDFHHRRVSGAAFAHEQVFVDATAYNRSFGGDPLLPPGTPSTVGSLSPSSSRGNLLSFLIPPADVVVVPRPAAATASAVLSSGNVASDAADAAALAAPLEDGLALTLFKKMRSLRKKIRFVQHHMKRGVQALSPAEQQKVEKRREFTVDLKAAEAEATRLGMFPSVQEIAEAERELEELLLRQAKNTGHGGGGGTHDGIDGAGGDDGGDDQAAALIGHSPGEPPRLLTPADKKLLRKKIAQSMARHADRIQQIQQQVAAARPPSDPHLSLAAPTALPPRSNSYPLSRGPPPNMSVGGASRAGSGAAVHHHPSAVVYLQQQPQPPVMFDPSSSSSPAPMGGFWQPQSNQMVGHFVVPSPGFTVGNATGSQFLFASPPVAPGVGAGGAPRASGGTQTIGGAGNPLQSSHPPHPTQFVYLQPQQHFSHASASGHGGGPPQQQQQQQQPPYFFSNAPAGGPTAMLAVPSPVNGSSTPAGSSSTASTPSNVIFRTDPPHQATMRPPSSPIPLPSSAFASPQITAAVHGGSGGGANAGPQMGGRFFVLSPHGEPILLTPQQAAIVMNQQQQQQQPPPHSHQPQQQPLTTSPTLLHHHHQPHAMQPQQQPIPAFLTNQAAATHHHIPHHHHHHQQPHPHQQVAMVDAAGHMIRVGGGTAQQQAAQPFHLAAAGGGNAALPGGPTFFMAPQHAANFGEWVRGPATPSTTALPSSHRPTPPPMGVVEGHFSIPQQHQLQPPR